MHFRTFTQASGNITRDAKLSYTQSGRPVITFQLAQNKRVRNQETGENETRYTNFWSVSYWPARYEDPEETAYRLTKGRYVAVEGEPELSSYTNQEGQTIPVLRLNNCNWLMFPAVELDSRQYPPQNNYQAQGGGSSYQGGQQGQRNSYGNDGYQSRAPQQSQQSQGNPQQGGGYNTQQPANGGGNGGYPSASQQPPQQTQQQPQQSQGSPQQQGGASHDSGFGVNGTPQSDPWNSAPPVGTYLDEEPPF